MFHGDLLWAAFHALHLHLSFWLLGTTKLYSLQTLFLSYDSWFRIKLLSHQDWYVVQFIQTNIYCAHSSQQQYTTSSYWKAMFRSDLGFPWAPFYKVGLLGWYVMERASLVSMIGWECACGVGLWVSPGRLCRLWCWLACLVFPSPTLPKTPSTPQMTRATSQYQDSPTNTPHMHILNLSRWLSLPVPLHTTPATLPYKRGLREIPNPTYT